MISAIFLLPLSSKALLLASAIATSPYGASALSDASHSTIMLTGSLSLEEL